MEFKLSILFGMLQRHMDWTLIAQDAPCYMKEFSIGLILFLKSNIHRYTSSVEYYNNHIHLQ